MHGNSLYAAHLILLELKKAAALTRQDETAAAQQQPTRKAQANGILPAAAVLRQQPEEAQR